MYVSINMRVHTQIEEFSESCGIALPPLSKAPFFCIRIWRKNETSSGTVCEDTMHTQVCMCTCMYVCTHVSTIVCRKDTIHIHVYLKVVVRFCTAIPIIIEGQFQVFQRFSSSKLVLKTVESCFVALNYYGNGSMCMYACDV
jgi:hypothetical protein